MGEVVRPRLSRELVDELAEYVARTYPLELAMAADELDVEPADVGIGRRLEILASELERDGPTGPTRRSDKPRFVKRPRDRHDRPPKGRGSPSRKSTFTNRGR